MFELLYQELKDVPLLTNTNIIIPQLTQLIKQAIARSLPKTGKVAVAFSGGLDSGLLALLLPGKQLYTIGLQASSDIDAAITGATQMHWPLKLKQISAIEAESAIHHAINLLSDAGALCNTTAVGIAATEFALFIETSKDHVTHIVTGLGAEELFAGYKRHTDYGKDFTPEKIHERLWHGLFTLEQRDLARDHAIAHHFKIQLITPFLDPDLVKYAMQIHPKLKVHATDKKLILREVARMLGLPECMASRKKIAIQYGSSMDTVLQKLAVKNGCVSKKEYIERTIKDLNDMK